MTLLIKPSQTLGCVWLGDESEGKDRERKDCMRKVKE